MRISDRGDCGCFCPQIPLIWEIFSQNFVSLGENYPTKRTFFDRLKFRAGNPPVPRRHCSVLVSRRPADMQGLRFGQQSAECGSAALDSFSVETPFTDRPSSHVVVVASGSDSRSRLNQLRSFVCAMRLTHAFEDSSEKHRSKRLPCSQSSSDCTSTQLIEHVYIHRCYPPSLLSIAGQCPAAGPSAF